MGFGGLAINLNFLFEFLMSNGNFLLDDDDDDYDEAKWSYALRGELFPGRSVGDQSMVVVQGTSPS